MQLRPCWDVIKSRPWIQINSLATRELFTAQEQMNSKNMQNFCSVIHQHEVRLQMEVRPIKNKSPCFINKSVTLCHIRVMAVSWLCQTNATLSTFTSRSSYVCHRLADPPGNEHSSHLNVDGLLEKEMPIRRYLLVIVKNHHFEVLSLLVVGRVSWCILLFV